MAFHHMPTLPCLQLDLHLLQCFPKSYDHCCRESLVQSTSPGVLNKRASYTDMYYDKRILGRMTQQPSPKHLLSNNSSTFCDPTPPTYSHLSSTTVTRHSK